MIDTEWMWGEWLEPGQDVNYMSDIVMKGDPEVGTAFYYMNLNYMAQMAEILGEDEDQQDFGHRHVLDPAEVGDDDDADEDFEHQDEFALGEHVGLAGLVDEFADFGHCAMYRQGFDLAIDDAAEGEAGKADDQAPGEEIPAGMAAEKGRQIRVGQVRQHQVGFGGGKTQRGENKQEQGKRPEQLATQEMALAGGQGGRLHCGSLGS